MQITGNKFIHASPPSFSSRRLFRTSVESRPSSPPAIPTPGVHAHGPAPRIEQPSQRRDLWCVFSCSTTDHRIRAGTLQASSVPKGTQEEQLRWRQTWLELEGTSAVPRFAAELDDPSTHHQRALESGSKKILPSTTAEICPSALCSVCAQTELGVASLGKDSREGAAKDISAHR